MYCDGLRMAGLHHLRWDGKDNAGKKVASGVYLYQLSTVKTVLTRKLLLLK